MLCSYHNKTNLKDKKDKKLRFQKKKLALLSVLLSQNINVAANKDTEA